MYALLPFLIIIIAFWFLLIRPQQKRQRQMREMQSQLSVGAEVMLTSGIYAEVREVADDHAVVQISDGVTIKVARAAIGQVLQPQPLVDAPTADTEPGSEVETGAVRVEQPTESHVGETPDETLERLRKQGENE